jgi:hypothetical protein
LSPDRAQEEGSSEQPAELEADAEVRRTLSSGCCQLPVWFQAMAPVSWNDSNERHWELVMSRCADMNKQRPQPEEKMGPGRRPVVRTWQKLQPLKSESKVGGACPLLVKMAPSVAQ